MTTGEYIKMRMRQCKNRNEQLKILSQELLMTVPQVAEIAGYSEDEIARIKCYNEKLHSTKEEFIANVLELARQGLNNCEIARRLQVSKATVKKYRKELQNA